MIEIRTALSVETMELTYVSSLIMYRLMVWILMSQQLHRFTRLYC